QQAVCADDDVDLSAGELGDDGLLLLLRLEAADHLDFHREAGEPLRQSAQVLEGENRGGREERDLLAVNHRFERRTHRDLGLAVPDVAAEQTIHRRRRLHVARDVANRGLLVGRQVVLERVVELLLPVRGRAERVTDDGLARSVELEELFRHVAHGLLHAALGFFPSGAAKSIERRIGAAGVLLDEIEPLERDEELVVAGVAKLHELLLAGFAVRVRRTGRELLEADESTDAVVDVDDEITDLQIAKIGEELTGGGTPALVYAPLFFEEIRFREERQTAGGQLESSG